MRTYLDEGLKTCIVALHLQLENQYDMLIRLIDLVKIYHVRMVHFCQYVDLFLNVLSGDASPGGEETLLLDEFCGIVRAGGKLDHSVDIGELSAEKYL